MARRAPFVLALLFLLSGAWGAVTSEVSRTDYVGTGALATYSWTFPVKAATELRVFKQDANGQDVELTAGVDYSTSAVAANGTGSITLTAGNLANGYKLSIQRGIPYTQTVTPGTAYNGATIATALDRLQNEIVRLKGDVDRAIKIPYLEAGGDSVTKLDDKASARANQALIFDSSGNVMVGGTVGVSASPYAQTLLDDTTATQARATLELTGVQPAAGAANTVLTTNGTSGVWQTIATANVSDDAITNAKAANVATATIKGRVTAGTGDPEDLTGTQATTLLNAFTADNGVSPGLKGLVPAPGVGDAAANKVLTVNGWAAAPASAIFYAKVSNSSTVAITSTGSATLNRMHVVSGTSADYDITISGLSPSTGDAIGFQVKDYSAASKQFRLDAGVGVKIAGRTRYLTLLHTNVVLLRWDGTDWQPLVLNLDTPWVDAGVITITAVTTNPTKGTTSTDVYYWRRVGDSCQVRYRYQHGVAGTNGSGNYRVGLPFPYDTARVGTRQAEGTSAASARVAGLGTSGITQIGVTDSSGYAWAHTTNNTSIGVSTTNENGAAAYVWSSTAFALGTANINFAADITYPATDW